MADNKGFMYAYGWNVFYEILLGLWSRKGEGFIAQQRARLWTIIIFVYLWLPQIASVPILGRDLNMIIDCQAVNLSFGLSILKLMFLYYHRNVIRSILDVIAEDWERVQEEEELEVMIQSARLSRIISIASFFLTTFSAFTCVLSQAWMVARGEKNVGLDPRLTEGLIFVSYFPFDTTNPYVFMLVWMGQAFGTFLGAASYGGPDSLLSMTVLHLCGQLNIVSISLRNLINSKIPPEPEVYWYKLSVIVKRHEELNQLSLVIRETFSTILLLQMVICSVSFCFQGYAMFTTLMDRNGAQLPVLYLVFALIYGTAIVLHLFMHCYSGDRLLTESTKVADDFYNTAWYNLGPREARAFLFVCHRARIPLELMAGKFCTFNLELFNSILKTSMGYLSMLMAMKERLID